MGNYPEFKILDRRADCTSRQMRSRALGRNLAVPLMIAAWSAAVAASPVQAQSSGAPTAAGQSESDVTVEPPREVAPSVWLIAGALRPMREPDGNTVVLEGPDGLIVFDTGRHLAHRVAIKSLAVQRKRGIVAIVNSHWHLDHTSGNRYLKAAYPQARVYASRAIERALPGFLAQSVADSRNVLESDSIPPQIKDDVRGDLATIADSAALRPDVPIEASRATSLAGRLVDINLAPNAATEGDVWIFDHSSGVAIVGDLVTMPSPFLDTACPRGWKAALGRISVTPFKTLVPGHGEPMTHAQFETYRTAFSALVDCSNSDRAKAECAAEWTRSTAALRGTDPRDLKLSQSMTEYYVGDVLRPHGGKRVSCGSA